MSAFVKVIHDGITYRIKIGKMYELQKYLESSLIFNSTIYDPSNPPPMSFDDLETKINETFPLTAESKTNYTYMCNLKSIFKALNETDFSLGVFSDFSRISDTINNMTDKVNTKLGYYNVISKMYQMYGEDVPIIYWETIGKLKKVKDSSQYSLSDRERSNILRLDSDMGKIEQRLLDDLKDGKGTAYQYQKLFLFYAYTEVPPIRRDYCNMVFDVDKNDVNSIDTKRFVILMKKYKNCKSSSGGNYEIELKYYPKALNAFKQFIEHHPSYKTGEHIIVSTKGKKVAPSNFNKLLSSIFFKGVGVDLLRKYAVNKVVDCEDVKNQKEIARVMRHTIKTRNENYVKENLNLK